MGSTGTLPTYCTKFVRAIRTFQCWCRFGSDPDWHQNDADPHADPTSSYTHVRKSVLKKKFSHSVVSLQCFIFLISDKDVIILSILVSILKCFGKKVWFINFLYAWHGYWSGSAGSESIPWLLIPVRNGRIRIHALPANPGPDPTKLCGSDPFRIHRSAVPGTVDYWFTFSIFIKTIRIILVFEFNFLFEAPLGQVTPVFLPIY